MSIKFGYIVVRHVQEKYYVNATHEVRPGVVNYATWRGFDITVTIPDDMLKKDEEYWHVAYTVFPDTGKVHSFVKNDNETEARYMLDDIDIILNMTKEEFKSPRL